MTTELIDTSGRRLSLRRGTSPTHTFTVVDDAGEAKSLSGATEVTFAIASARNAATRDLQLVLDAGTSHNGVGGVVSVAFTKEQTEALTVGRRWAELWITDSAGRRDLVGEGVCMVYDSLTTVP